MSELGIFYPTIPEGDGDFSTATMNVVFHEEDIGIITIYAPFLSSFEDPDVGEVEYISPDFGNVYTNENIDIVLYKDYSAITIKNPDELTISVDSGNAIIREDNDTYYVLAHGDFTLGVYSPK